MFGDNYIKFKDVIMNDNKIMITGMFQAKKYKADELEFNITRIVLLENVKNLLTKRINIELSLKKLDEEFMKIITKYAQKPGTVELGIQINDLINHHKIMMLNDYKKIDMSDEFIEELNNMDGVSFNIVLN